MHVLYLAQVGNWSVFVEGGKPEEKKTFVRARREPIANSTHIWHQAGIAPGPHYWEVDTCVN